VSSHTHSISHCAVLLACFLLAVPAFAKSHNAQPVSCDQLWSAVKDTLGNHGNYSILSMSDEKQIARFVIIGTSQPLTNSVTLVAKKNGCQMKVSAPFDGIGIDEEGVFRNRVAHMLAKQKLAEPAKPADAAKPAESAKPAETASPAAPVAKPPKNNR
jgi:hypothetical protein